MQISYMNYLYECVNISIDKDDTHVKYIYLLSKTSVHSLAVIVPTLFLSLGLSCNTQEKIVLHYIFFFNLLSCFKSE